MHIGIDFDNTLVNYDALFHRCASQQGLIPANLPPTKAAVRAWLWQQPDGNIPWTKLQGEVYGRRMAEAVVYPGVAEFFACCRTRAIPISIISHKLEYPTLGPQVNLRAAALAWMERHGFFATNGFGLSRAALCFEDSRADKLSRIAQRQCTHFIDDLLELLQDRDFPAQVVKLLFAPTGAAALLSPDIQPFSSWLDIRHYLEGAAS